MSLFEDTNPRALKELLGEIHSGMTVLPDFQRDFVWDPRETQELVLSIASNYPAGSLLRVRDKHGYFACREFEGAPKIDGKKHTFLVLDGQQRLTSLYQAFFGVGDHRYYIDLNKLIEGKDFEDAIFHKRANTTWVKKHETFDAQASGLIMPLSILKGGSGGFLEWLFAVTNPLPNDERIKLLDALKRINDLWIKTVDDYHFPVVTLSDTTAPDALCTLFETLNRTGVKLSVFELLTASFWPHKVKLRELWAKALKEKPIIGDFEIDPYYVLQAVSLICRPTPSCKRSDVLNLDAKDIPQWWDAVIDGLAVGLEILRDDCGVALPKWLPYQTMVVPLAAVLGKIPLPKTPEAGTNRDKLRQWFWSSVFGLAYESAPNSQTAKDVTEITAWLAGGNPPQTVTGFRFDPRVLRDTTPRQRALYRGVICLVLRNKSRDFHTLSVITGKLMLDEGIDDHHIFPSDFLEKKKGVAARLRDCVLNRTLIDRTTNQMISNRAPSDYMKEIRDTTGFPFKEFLDSHQLPSGADSPFWTDDYESFLKWRETALWEDIKTVTGVKVASELVEEAEAEEAGQVIT